MKVTPEDKVKPPSHLNFQSRYPPSHEIFQHALCQGSVDFFWNNPLYFYELNLRFKGKNQLFLQLIRVCVTGQPVWRIKILAGKVAFEAGHCSLTGCYIEP